MATMSEEEKKRRARLPGRVIAGFVLIFLAGMFLVWLSDGIHTWSKESPQPVVLKARVEPPEAPSISMPATNTIYMGSRVRINNPLGPRQAIRAEIVDDDMGVTYTMWRIVGKKEVATPMFPAGDSKNPGDINGSYSALEFQIDPTNLKNPHTAKLRYWFSQSGQP